MLIAENSIQFNPAVIQSLNATDSGRSSAEKVWAEILSNASHTGLKTIIYSHPEEKDRLQIDNVQSIPPSTFAGKLMAFLFHRFKYFNGAPDKGVTIISSESINGKKKLEANILELAHLNNLNPEFLDWIENSNSFI